MDHELVASELRAAAVVLENYARGLTELFRVDGQKFVEPPVDPMEIVDRAGHQARYSIVCGLWPAIAALDRAVRNIGLQLRDGPLPPTQVGVWTSMTELQLKLPEDHRDLCQRQLQRGAVISERSQQNYTIIDERLGGRLVVPREAAEWARTIALGLRIDADALDPEGEASSATNSDLPAVSRKGEPELPTLPMSISARAKQLNIDRRALRKGMVDGNHRFRRFSTNLFVFCDKESRPSAADIALEKKLQSTPPKKKPNSKRRT
jgi:hypothetical protein